MNFYIFQGDQFQVPNMIPLLSAAFLVFVLDFYIEAVASARLESYMTSRISSIGSFLAALTIAFFWEHIPYSTLMPYEIHKHGLAPGAVLATICFISCKL